MKHEIIILSIVSFLIYYLYITNNNTNNDVLNTNNVTLKLNIIPNFLSLSECNKIISSCDNFKPSKTTTGIISGIEMGRTSSSIFVEPNTMKCVDDVKDKVSHLLNIDKSYMEKVQITKYEKGQDLQPCLCAG